MKRKNKNIFQTLNDLNNNEIKIFMVLEKLSQKKGYSYITPKSLSKKLNIDEKEVYSSIYNLIKKGSVYFIDLKDKDKLLERRFYTDKFNFFNDSRKKDQLVPTMKEINDLKEKVKIEAEQNKIEAENKLKEIELNNLVDEYWENIDNIMYNDLYIKAEEKYAMSVNGTAELKDDFQIACFERLAPIYMKMIIKENLAKEMGTEIPNYFEAKSSPVKNTSEDKKIPDTFEEKLQQSWDDFEFYR